MSIPTTLSAERKHQIIDVTHNLIHAQSLAGEEGEAAKIAYDAMRALHYDDVCVDSLGNVVGVLRPTPAANADDPLVFDSHLDTVAAVGAWTKNPFGGEVSDGRIWGRGAADMKGALAACICGAVYARDDGLLQNTVLVSASVNEEQIEGLAFADVLATYRPGRVVICEATNLKLNTGGRGRAEIFRRRVHHHVAVATHSMPGSALPFASGH